MIRWLSILFLFVFTSHAYAHETDELHLYGFSPDGKVFAYGTSVAEHSYEAQITFIDMDTGEPVAPSPFIEREETQNYANSDDPAVPLGVVHKQADALFKQYKPDPEAMVMVASGPGNSSSELGNVLDQRSMIFNLGAMEGTTGDKVWMQRVELEHFIEGPPRQSGQDEAELPCYGNYQNMRLVVSVMSASVDMPAVERRIDGVPACLSRYRVDSAYLWQGSLFNNEPARMIVIIKADSMSFEGSRVHSIVLAYTLRRDKGPWVYSLEEIDKSPYTFGHNYFRPIGFSGDFGQFAFVETGIDKDKKQLFSRLSLVDLKQDKLLRHSL